MKFVLKFILFPLLIFSSGEKQVTVFNYGQPPDTARHDYKAKNVIIVVLDGPRYSETWGDPAHQYIPKTFSLSGEGVIFSKFLNEGPTYTNSGFTAITTGNYQEIDNTGQQLPEEPSIFQYWLKKSGRESEAAWIIESKGKLTILSDCTREDWEGKYNPSANCGDDGTGNGYREDSITLSAAIDILKKYHPTLALIGFKEPDYSGHQNNWNGYLEGIRKTDEYVFSLWNFLQTDSVYRNKTAFFVTNDHGRHLDGISGGFANHGDNCEGCRHISLFVAGPDFISGKIVPALHELTDISATVAEILDFDMPSGKGKSLREIFREPH